MSTRNTILSVISTSFSVIIIALVVIGVYKGALIAYDFGYRVFTETPISGEPGRDIEVTILDGTSSKEVGDILEEKGLIRDATLFFIQEMLSSHKGKIKPGIYTLNTSMTAEQMIEAMAEKDEDEDEDTEG